jgi:hypothetical protein
MFTLCRPHPSGTGEGDGVAMTALALAQMRAPECRSVARLLRTRSATRAKPQSIFDRCLAWNAAAVQRVGRAK